MAEMNWDDAEAYDEKHRVVRALIEAFEDRGGGCGHDLGLTGALAVVEAWERIRTPEKVADLSKIGAEPPDD